MSYLVMENERTNYKSMPDVEYLNYSINEHMKRIKDNLEGMKIMELFQLMGEHSVKYAGISFMSNKTMANKLGVSTRTIQRYTSKLERLKVILKAPTRRKINNSQTSNTYIIMPILKKVVMGGVVPINPSFNPKIQESNKYIEVVKKAKKLIELKFNDVLKQGKEIDNLSSYLSTMLKSWDKQAYIQEKARQKTVLRQQKQRFQAEESIVDSIFVNGELYNWLED